MIEFKEVIASTKDAKFIEEIQIQTRDDSFPLFASDSLDFILSIINSKRGIIVLYFNDDELVCLFELSCSDNPYEIEEKYHISKYLQNIDINNMAVAESFIVMPKYRGKKLQEKMFIRMEEIARNRGITSIIGTVHPDNIYSNNNFELLGYNTIASIVAHGGPRLLKYKDLSK